MKSQSLTPLKRIKNAILGKALDPTDKHAFHSINAACECAEDEMLFPGCEDTYGGFSNDYAGGLGPRGRYAGRP